MPDHTQNWQQYMARERMGDIRRHAVGLAILISVVA